MSGEEEKANVVHIQ
ncbi:Protein of unknown function [Bacillus cereus]|nr:Protein of unknown function [Bacillus cereus]